MPLGGVDMVRDQSASPLCCSYCDLRTSLAVEVFGVQPKVGIPYFLILGISFSGFLLLILLIFCFNEHKKRRLLAVETEMNEIEKLMDLMEP